MKKVFLALIAVFLLASVTINFHGADFPLCSYSWAADLNLRARWTPNTEPDMKEYRLYRLDLGRQLIGTIPHPTALYEFTVVVPDGSEVLLRFVLTAVDQSNNESADSNEATYPFDQKPPDAVREFGVERR